MLYLQWDLGSFGIKRAGYMGCFSYIICPFCLFLLHVNIIALKKICKYN